MPTKPNVGVSGRELIKGKWVGVYVATEQCIKNYTEVDQLVFS